MLSMEIALVQWCCVGNNVINEVHIRNNFLCCMYYPQRYISGLGFGEERAWPTVWLSMPWVLITLDYSAIRVPISHYTHLSSFLSDSACLSFSVLHISSSFCMLSISSYRWEWMVSSKCDRLWEKGPLGSGHQFLFYCPIWKSLFCAFKCILNHEKLIILTQAITV